jgi:hypothetical protein
VTAIGGPDIRNEQRDAVPADDTGVVPPVSRLTVSLLAEDRRVAAGAVVLGMLTTTDPPDLATDWLVAGHGSLAVAELTGTAPRDEVGDQGPHPRPGVRHPPPPRPRQGFSPRDGCPDIGLARLSCGQARGCWTSAPPSPGWALS